MALNLYRLARALKVSTEIPDEDTKGALNTFERSNRLVAERVLKRIEELVEKVEKL